VFLEGLQVLLVVTSAGFPAFATESGVFTRLLIA